MGRAAWPKRRGRVNEGATAGSRIAFMLGLPQGFPKGSAHLALHYLAHRQAARETACMVQEDRRKKRSSDPLVALHYQLAEARREGEHEAMVIADSSGVMVAGSGAWPTCEELAAYAPLLLEQGHAPALSSRVESLRQEVSVHAMRVAEQTVFLCARGGRKSRETLSRAAEGISRILTAA